MMMTPAILVVDRSRRNLDLLTQFLGKEGFSAIAVASLEEVDAVLARASLIHLALVDLAGFDQDVWERCDRLRDRGVPFLVISPRENDALSQAGISHGARAMLVKPLSPRALLSMIRELVEM